MNKNKPQILLTNDDGINSPGLWAVAEALSEIGYVWVTAPRDQASGAGRSMPSTSDGIIIPQELQVNGKTWTVYAIGGSPAQTVQHAIFEIMDTPPDLVVSGINYGLNMGTGITVSGTVGAAMEAAVNNIPAIAVSLDTPQEYHLSHSPDVNFESAAYFTKYFAERLLSGQFDPRIQVLKLEIPSMATPETPWEMARLSPVRYYRTEPPKRTDWSQVGGMGYSIETDMSLFPEDCDVYVVKEKGHVAVTPLTLDMTSRVDFDSLAKQFREA